MLDYCLSYCLKDRLANYYSHMNPTFTDMLLEICGIMPVKHFDSQHLDIYYCPLPPLECCISLELQPGIT